MTLFLRHASEAIQLIIFNKSMKKELILLSIIVSVHMKAIEASAELIEYDPFIFQLQFSEMVTLPKFQLFLNCFQELKYTVLTKQLQSFTYLFQIEPFQLPQVQEVERYTVVFNNPLAIGHGKLSTQLFQLEVEKKKVEIHFSQAWQVILIVVAYLLLNLAIFGSVLIEFLQIYCLIIFKSNMNTDLHIDISKGLMLLNPYTQDIQVNTKLLYVCLFGPTFLILSFGTIGFLVKKFGGKNERIILKFAYQVVVYDLFVCVSLAFILPMAFNSFQFFILLSQGTVAKKTIVADYGSLFSYLSLVTLISVAYLFVYVLNPKIKQQDSSWKKYQESETYHSFRRLHEILIQDHWYTRNKSVFAALKKILIALCFFIDPGFEICVLLLEFLHIVYIFMVQPYRQGHYLNIALSCRVLMFLFYGTAIAAKSYFSIGHAMLNFKSIRNFLVGRDAFFLAVCAAILLSIFYEIYVKCSNLNYRIRLVREENEFKLKITERTRNEESVRRRKRTVQLTSFNDEIEPQLRGQSGSVSERQRKLDLRIALTRADTPQGFDSPRFSSLRRMKTDSHSSRSQSKTGKSKRSSRKAKWQKESLLADIVRDK